MNKIERIHDLMFEGRKSVEARFYRRAQKCFEQARELDPDNSDILNAYAAVLCELNDGEWNEEALGVLQEALKIDPRNVKVLNNLGNYYYSIGDYTKTVIHLEKALSITPNEAILHTNVAMAYRMLGRFTEADNHIQIALRTNPKDPWIRFHHGLSYVFSGLLRKQIVSLHKARQIFAEVLEHHFDRDLIPIPAWMKFIVGYLNSNFSEAEIVEQLNTHIPEHVPYLGQGRDRLKHPSLSIH